MMTLGQKRTRKYGSLIVTEEMKTDLTKNQNGTICASETLKRAMFVLKRI